MTKKYKLFAGDDYYPQGGYYDYQGIYTTIEECKEKVASLCKSVENTVYSYDWAHIVVDDKIVMTVKKPVPLNRCTIEWEENKDN